MTSSKIAAFRREVWNYYKKHGRNDLPWRKTTDPYKILVSEVMLQQTQVPRVIEKYKPFIKKFPTARQLSRVTLAAVLKEWNGLGYNRRGKYLHDAAKEIVAKHKGIFPKDVIALRKLSGMGPYTASAVRVFAFDLPDILIETNVRTAYIHYFFSSTKPKSRGFPSVKISDTDIVSIAALAASGQDPRKWHWALMDYGSHLKRSGVRNNSQSKHYMKQSKFEGSVRQLRGEILRQLHEDDQPRNERGLPSLIRMRKALTGLERDGLIRKEKERWRIA